MQQAIQPLQGPIHVKITLPGSKSISLRALFLSALAEGVSEISGISTAPSILAMVKLLHQLGIAIQFDDKTKSCIIAGGTGKFPKKQATIWCNQFKSILHYLMAGCATSGGIYYFDGPSSLTKKSNMYLLDILLRQGIQLIPSDVKKLPFTLVGAESLEGGELTFHKPIYPHLVSALLMIAPFARSPFTFNLPDKSDHPSVELTCNMMAEYGVLVHRIHQTQLMIPIPQRYQAKDYSIEPDFNLASYFFAAAVIAGGDVTIQPVKRSLAKQSGSKFLLILEKMGCQIVESHTGLTLRCPEKPQGIEVSIRKFSDTFLALAAIAPFAKSPTRIAHIDHITQSEFARMTAVKSMFIKMGIHVESGNDWIKIFPGTPHGFSLNINSDYRLGMMLALIGLKISGICIENAERITNIYPHFFKMWNQLGENININA